MTSKRFLIKREAPIRRASPWAIVVAVLVSVAHSAEPEYADLRIEPGTPIEVKGAMNGSGTFAATDIELLAEARRPKLRGAVERVDEAARAFAMFGLTIGVNDETEYEAEGGGRFSFDNIAVGQFIEVSCGVKEGRWTARKVTGGRVKAAPKIKGTVTRTAMDGAPPDTVWIENIRIVLDESTDANEGAQQGRRAVEEELFGDASVAKVLDAGHGIDLLDGKLAAGAQYRQSFLALDDSDLTRQFQSDVDEARSEARLELRGNWPDRYRSLAELRMRKNFVVASDQDLGDPDGELDFIQLWIAVPDILRSGIALQVGRQDVDEPREWLFDEYLDAARIHYYGTQSLVVQAAYVHAVVPLDEQAETWTDYFLLAKWVPDDDNLFGVYAFKRTDTSVRNREPFWAGAMVRGEIDWFRPWLDASIMRGEDRGETLDAWAVDVGATLLFMNLPFAPSLSAGYAVATGDDTGADTVDRTFRQTGYEDNTARFGGVTTVSYYGTVLDPELSNMTIGTIGAGVRPFPGSSIECFYHAYRQVEADDDIEGGDLTDPPARPNGVDVDLGWAFDVVAATPELWGHLRARWVFGLFEPGRAFNPRQETAYRNYLEFILTM